ncbi:hypothetical protein Barb6XT_00646 [Bacteroidales bacterium Barb6XT]|nr:hypothetical protein Barb6XT_00646 [Bacteroidales bacterium Barb6XT]
MCMFPLSYPKLSLFILVKDTTFEVVTKSITGKRRWGDSGLSGNIRAMEKGELYNIKMPTGRALFPLAGIWRLTPFPC